MLSGLCVCVCVCALLVQRDFLSFTTLSPARLADLFASRDSAAAHADLLMMQSELCNDYGELCSIFRAYSRVDSLGVLGPDISAASVIAAVIAAAGQPSQGRRAPEWGGCLLMTARDYAEFIKDLKINSRALKQSMIGEVFSTCTDPKDGVRKKTHISLHAHSDANFATSCECVLRVCVCACVLVVQRGLVSRVALSPGQFVEALVRSVAAGRCIDPSGMQLDGVRADFLFSRRLPMCTCVCVSAWLHFAILC